MASIKRVKDHKKIGKKVHRAAVLCTTKHLKKERIFTFIVNKINQGETTYSIFTQLKLQGKKTKRGESYDQTIH